MTRKITVIHRTHQDPVLHINGHLEGSLSFVAADAIEALIAERYALRAEGERLTAENVALLAGLDLWRDRAWDCLINGAQPAPTLPPLLHNGMVPGWRVSAPTLPPGVHAAPDGTLLAVGDAIPDGWGRKWFEDWLAYTDGMHRTECGTRSVPLPHPSHHFARGVKGRCWCGTRPSMGMSLLAQSVPYLAPSHPPTR